MKYTTQSHTKYFWFIALLKFNKILKIVKCQFDFAGNILYILSSKVQNIASEVKLAFNGFFNRVKYYFIKILSCLILSYYLLSVFALQKSNLRCFRTNVKNQDFCVAIRSKKYWKIINQNLRKEKQNIAR